MFLTMQWFWKGKVNIMICFHFFQKISQGLFVRYEIACNYFAMNMQKEDDLSKKHGEHNVTNKVVSYLLRNLGLKKMLDSNPVCNRRICESSSLLFFFVFGKNVQIWSKKKKLKEVEKRFICWKRNFLPRFNSQFLVKI